MSYYSSAEQIEIRRPYVSSRYDDYGRPYVPSHSGMSSYGSIPLYPTQSLTAPSQYRPSIPLSMNNLPSHIALQNYSSNYEPNYRQVPSQGLSPAPRSFSTSHLYDHVSAYAQSLAVRPPAPVHRHTDLAPLLPVSSFNASNNIFGEDDEMPSPTLPPMLSPVGTTSLSSLDSPTSPTSPHHCHNRRHPAHPEGTPQPKGRGARKSSKMDDMSKTLACNGCDAMFARKHDLDRHRRIHTLEAPYVCRGCQRSYRRSDARKRHWDQEPACSILHARNSSEKSNTP